MAITTSPAFSAWRSLIIAVAFVILSAWGAYDLWVKIPHQEQVFSLYDAAKTRLAELDARKTDRENRGGGLSQAEVAEYSATKKILDALAPGGTAPTQPGKFNRVTQWFYISCILCVPPFVRSFWRAKHQSYRLEEDGALHFTGDPALESGVWTQAEIADIDMSAWMAKSIAHVVHLDGRRLMLDAYMHRNLHLIVGAIASRLHPAQWDDQAKIVKSGEESGKTAAAIAEAPAPDEALDQTAA